MGFNRPQLRELSLNVSYQAAHFGDRMSREVYKYVLYPPEICSSICSFDYEKSSRLVSESLEKFSTFDPVLNSTVLTFMEYLVDKQARQCL